MAQKKSPPSGMQDYVRSREAGEAKQKGHATRNGSNEDLKVGVPKNGQPANSRQLRSQHPGVVKAHQQHSKVQAGPQSNTQKHIWGTDASSIGDTSDIPNEADIRAAQRFVAHGAFATEVRHAGPAHPEAQSSEASVEDEDDGSEEDEDEDELPDDPLSENVNESEAQRTQRITADIDNMMATGSFPYMQGDSYPSTTSGPRSIQQAESHHALPLRSDRTPAQNAPSHRQMQRQPLGPQQAQGQGRAEPQQGQQSKHQSRPANVQLKRPEATNHPAAQQQEVQTFAFAAAPRAKANVKQPTNHQLANGLVGNHSRQSLPTNAARQVPVAETERNNCQSTQDAAAQAERQLPQADFPTQQSVKPARQPTLNLPPAAPPVGEPSPPLYQTAQDEGMSDSQTYDEKKTPCEDEMPSDLDYDVPELHAMKFSDLKSQPFDSDPRREPAVFPDMTTSDPIDKQMGVIAALQPKDQHVYLTSLPIDGWEQAGDWFLGRFGEALSKLKNLRQEKRKAARGFEQEIEIRHLAVAKRRKLTESALDDMRTSGKTVLQGTPKKSKQGK